MLRRTSISKSCMLSLMAISVASSLTAIDRARAADFIVNGSFEANPFNGTGGGYTLGLVGSAVTGWFIPTSDGTYPWGLENSNSFGAGPTPYGNQWIVLGETGAGGPSMVDRTIQQTVTGLTVGQHYTLSFAISMEGQGSALCCAEVQVSFLSGSSTPSATFSTVAGYLWGNWTTDSMDVLATATSLTLQFKDLAVEFPGANDVGLDNVSLVGAGGTSPVPLPATLPLFATGLVGLGLLGRRRKKAA